MKLSSLFEESYTNVKAWRAAVLKKYPGASFRTRRIGNVTENAWSVDNAKVGVFTFKPGSTIEPHPSFPPTIN